MAKVALRFAESALADLDSIRDWYAEKDVPEVGQRWRYPKHVRVVRIWRSERLFVSER